MSIDSPPTAERYKDSPFLLLVDCYVLDAIGQLPPQQKEALEKLEPRLQETFGGSTGGWREVVEEQMGFVPTMPLRIEMAWTAYQELEKSAGRESVAGHFVREFVAQNFPALLEGDAAPSAGTAAAPGRSRRKRKQKQ